MSHEGFLPGLTASSPDRASEASQSPRSKQGGTTIYSKAFRDRGCAGRCNMLCIILKRVQNFDIRSVEVQDYESAHLVDAQVYVKGARIEMSDIVKKYICWRQSILFVGTMLTLICLIYESVNLLVLFENGDLEWDDYDNTTAVSLFKKTLNGSVPEVPGTLPGVPTYDFHLSDLPDTILADRTQARLHNIQDIFKYLSVFQLTLMFVFLTMASCRWYDFTHSRVWVRIAWSVSFLVPFLGVSFPWLTYLPPEWIVSDTCHWALGLAQSAYRDQYNEAIDLGIGPACDGPLDEMGTRLTAPALLLSTNIAAHQCADLADPGVGLPPDVLDHCAEKIAPLLKPTVVHLVGIIGVFMKWAVYIPSLIMMVIGWMHLLPTVLGFVFGMTRGLKVLKLAVPAARLPTWLLVSITACSTPVLCFMFTTFVCLMGTITSSCATILLLCAGLIYVFAGPSLLRAKEYEPSRYKLYCVGYIEKVLQVLAFLGIVLPLFYNDRFDAVKDYGLNMLSRSVVSWTLAVLNAITKFFGFGCATTVVFSDWSLNIANSVYLRPEVRDAAGIQMMTKGLLVELSVFFPKRTWDKDGKRQYEWDFMTSDGELGDGSVVVSVSQFDKAVKAYKGLKEGQFGNAPPTEDDKYKLRALYKQATDGDVESQRPNFWSAGWLLNRDKLIGNWEARDEIRGMSRESARCQYVDKIIELGGRWT